MAYSTCERAAALIPNVLNGASNYAGLADTIVPGSAALVSFHSSGCSIIEATMTARGFAPATGTGLDDWLADLEATYVAMRAEQARGSPRTAPGERTRAQQFKSAFNDGIKKLKSMDLSRLGFAYTSALYVGGISSAEKTSVESNTDRVEPRFSRGQFDN